MAAARSKRKTYTQEQKDNALAVYVEKGPREAARLTKIPARTIGRWATAAGVSTEVATKTADAVAVARLRREELREQLRTKLLEQALAALERMDAEHIDFKVVSDGAEAGSRIEKVVYPKPTPAGFQSYATAAAILLDKFRLEMGEHTGRERHEVSGGLALAHLSDADLKRTFLQAVRPLSG